MQSKRPLSLPRVLAIFAAILLARVTVSVIAEYRHYFPPNFDADFLRGRESYFWGAYHWAFYAHLIAGPASLLLGATLVSSGFRKAFPGWHRRLGRIQGVCVLLLVAPSGLWMSFYAATGAVAAIGLASLAIATGVCVALGWRAAVARKFTGHRRWMERAFILLCSAVVIRVIGGLATALELDALWIYPTSTWVSWVVPLLVFESLHWFRLPEWRSERAATSS